jgi:hypothetical protein
MATIHKTLRILVASGAILTFGACNGGLGGVLGSVLGGGTQQTQSGQINGVVRSLDTQSQQINIQDNSSGQSYWVQYDNRTQVVYRNQVLAPTSLRQGDNVSARIQANGNNSYYTDYVQVN